MRPVPAPYDALADEYYDASHQTSRNFDVTSKAALKTFCSLIPADGQVLEVGAGRGRCREFLDIDSGVRVIQLDSSSRMLAISPREPALLRVVHEAELLPFMSGAFSCVTAFLCDPFLGLNFLAEAHRVLSKDGLLVATTPAYEWGAPLRKELKLELNQTRFITRDGAERHVPSVLVSRDQIRAMLARVGFVTSTIRVEAHRLPQGTHPVSPDVQKPAACLQVDPFELDVLYTIIAAK
jgi:SAM-dependent methyltransferase